MNEEERRGPVAPHRRESDAGRASASQTRLSPLGRLTGPELERRIALLERQAVRYPELAEACLSERDRLARILAEKRAARASA